MQLLKDSKYPAKFRKKLKKWQSCRPDPFNTSSQPDAPSIPPYIIIIESLSRSLGISLLISLLFLAPCKFYSWRQTQQARRNPAEGNPPPPAQPHEIQMTPVPSASIPSEDLSTPLLPASDTGQSSLSQISTGESEEKKASNKERQNKTPPSISTSGQNIWKKSSQNSQTHPEKKTPQSVTVPKK